MQAAVGTMGGVGIAQISVTKHPVMQTSEGLHSFFSLKNAGITYVLPGNIFPPPNDELESHKAQGLDVPLIASPLLSKQSLDPFHVFRYC